MENSTEAIMIGVNVIVFIIAVSAAMTLMQSVNGMVEVARVSIEQNAGGSLMQKYGNTEERTFSGAEVYALYGQQLEGENGDKTILVKKDGSTYTLEQFISLYGTNYLSETFVLFNEKENEFVLELK